MNLVDKIIGYFDPMAGLQRRAARKVLSQYEAAEPTRLRKFHRETASQNQDVLKSARAVRAQARHLAKNHDIARGALRTMVNNIVGPGGIGIEPQPRRADGTIHEEYAKALSALYRNWKRRPEVTHRHHFSQVQRMMCRAWIRDGESFAQRLLGPVAYLDHGTTVPFSLEMFEAEMVPFDYSDGARITQGIERNVWGKPVRYFVYKQSPNELYRLPTLSDLKPIGFDSIYHLATFDHIGQLRGVSEFASVITRLEDIKDYEESERVAAKIAAMLTAYVKKGTPDLYGAGSDGAQPSTPRSLSFAPGMIIDDLAIGEEIGLIDSKRPNPNVLTFRQGQLRAVAAGIGSSYSSISRDYGGTYSSQRQELVEQWINYATLTDEFVGMFLAPTWEDFVTASSLSVLPIPKDVVPGSEIDAIYVAQAMPWIDPLKEALGAEALVKAGFASEVEMIRRRGANPREVLEQIEAYRKLARDKGLTFTTMVPQQVTEPPAEDKQD